MSKYRADVWFIPGIVRLDERKFLGLLFNGVLLPALTPVLVHIVSTTTSSIQWDIINCHLWSICAVIFQNYEKISWRFFVFMVLMHFYLCLFLHDAFMSTFGFNLLPINREVLFSTDFLFFSNADLFHLSIQFHFLPLLSIPWSLGAHSLFSRGRSLESK